MDKKTKEQKRIGNALKPRVIIGKNGLNEESIKLIKNELKKYPLVKIKMLPTFIEEKNKKEVAKDIADKTNLKLVELKGFTIILARK